MDLRILVVIIGMAAVTYVPRVLPILILTRLKLPSVIMEWLEFIPAAILAALLTSVLFLRNGQVSMEVERLLPALPSFFVALKTRSLIKTVVTGIVTMALINNM